MDANSVNKEDDYQNSPALLKIRVTELENKLLIERQRYILLQSELESSASIASKRLDLYKNQCAILKEKMTALENENKALREKDLKNGETIQSLLQKTERVDKEYGFESQEKCKYLKINDNNVKVEADAHGVDPDNYDSDFGMQLYSPEPESENSLTLINGECSAPRKKLKSSSDSITCYDGVSTKDNHSPLGNSQTPLLEYTQSARRKYWGRIPTSEQKQWALNRAEQLQRNILNPSCAKSVTLSHLSSSYRFTLGHNFCKDNNLSDNDTEMILECEDGAEHAVHYIANRGAFSRGWMSFALALRLEIGDVLVFELIAPARFKVHVVKAIQEI